MRITPMLSGIGILLLLGSCTASTDTSKDDTTANDTANTPTTEVVVDLVEKIEYNTDSTFKMAYQVDKNTGNKHGIYKEYDLSNEGKLSTERMYVQNRIEGVEKIYFENGQVDVELSYENGIHNGPFKYYYEDGTIKQKGNYVDGKIEGLLNSYYPNGVLREEVTHVEGVTQGLFKEYNENKTLKAEGGYTSKGDQENLEHGLLKMYNGEGALIQKMICKDGQCCTVWTLEDGDIKPSSKLCAAIISSQAG